MNDNARMKYIKVLLLALLIQGCGESSDYHMYKVKSSIASNIEYIKDARGLCYAAIYNTTYRGDIIISITTVPCEKVFP